MLKRVSNNNKKNLYSTLFVLDVNNRQMATKDYKHFKCLKTHTVSESSVLGLTSSFRIWSLSSLEILMVIFFCIQMFTGHKSTTGADTAGKEN